MTCRGHYRDIYNPAHDESHQVRGITMSAGVLPDGTPVTYKCFVYYEGYGQKSIEKKEFMCSVNADNPFWSEECRGKVIPVTESSNGGKEIRFNPIARVRVKSSEKCVIEEHIDTGDRQERVSRNFADMLECYVEKCDISERSNFFHGLGVKWGNNKYLMGEMGRIFDWINEMLNDPEWNIGLSDISVKRFPKEIYRDIEKLYREYMANSEMEEVKEESIADIHPTEIPEKKSEFKFNPKAAEFYPSISPIGHCIVQPPKPMGEPPNSSRPTSRVDSSSQLAWNLHHLNDKKIEELDNKLQLLISLHGPVVCAEKI